MKQHLGGTIIRDSAWAWILELAGFASSIIAFLLLGRLLGPTGYGRYVAIFAVTTPLGGLAYSGVTLSVIHHIVRQRESPSVVMPSCLSIISCSCTVAAAIAFVVCRTVIKGASVLVLCLIIASELCLGPLFELMSTTIQAVKGYAAAAQFRLLPLGLRVIGFVVLAAVGKIDLPNVAIASIIFGVISAAVIARSCRTGLDLRLRFGMPRVRYMRTSFMYSIGVASFSVQNDSDKVVLSANGMQREGGIYAAAYRLTQLGQIPIRGIVSATHQRFLSHGADNQRLLPFTRLLALIAAAYGVVFGVALFFAAPVVSRVMGGGFAGTTDVMRWLSPFILVRTQSSFPLNALLGLGRTGIRAILMGSSAMLSLGLYIALVPSMGWKGAVVGTLIGETSLSSAAWVCLIIFDRRPTPDARIETLATQPDGIA